VGGLLEDLLDRLDSRVGLGSVLLSSGLLVPVEDLILVQALRRRLWMTHSTDEGGDEGDTSLGTGDSLTETEEKGQVTAVMSAADYNLLVYLLDALLLEVLGGLDTLVGGGNLDVSPGIRPSPETCLDQDSLLVDTERLVKVNELVSLGNCSLYLISFGYL
jgi:hypothetical protein